MAGDADMEVFMALQQAGDALKQMRDSGFRRKQRETLDAYYTEREGLIKDINTHESATRKSLVDLSKEMNLLAKKARGAKTTEEQTSLRSQMEKLKVEQDTTDNALSRLLEQKQDIVNSIKPRYQKSLVGLRMDPQAASAALAGFEAGEVNQGFQRGSQAQSALSAWLARKEKSEDGAGDEEDKAFKRTKGQLRAKKEMTRKDLIAKGYALPNADVVPDQAAIDVVRKEATALDQTMRQINQMSHTAEKWNGATAEERVQIIKNLKAQNAANFFSIGRFVVGNALQASEIEKLKELLGELSLQSYGETASKELVQGFFANSSSPVEMAKKFEAMGDTEKNIIAGFVAKVTEPARNTIGQNAVKLMTDYKALGIDARKSTNEGVTAVRKLADEYMKQMGEDPGALERIKNDPASGLTTAWLEGDKPGDYPAQATRFYAAARDREVSTTLISRGEKLLSSTAPLSKKQAKELGRIMEVIRRSPRRGKK